MENKNKKNKTFQDSEKDTNEFEFENGENL